MARVYQEVEKFKATGPTDKEIADEREALLRGYETASKQNGFWMAQLIALYEGEAEPADPLALPDAYSNPTIVGTTTLKPGDYRFPCKHLDGKSFLVISEVGSGKELARDDRAPPRRLTAGSSHGSVIAVGGPPSRLRRFGEVSPLPWRRRKRAGGAASESAWRGV